MRLNATADAHIAASGVRVARGAASFVCLAAVLASELALAGADSFGAVPQRVRVNGVTLTLRTLPLEGQPAALLDALEKDWGAPAHLAPDRRAARTDERWIFGRQRGPFHETLTLRALARGGQTFTALLAVQDLRRVPEPVPVAPLPLRGGLVVLNVVESPDERGGPTIFTLDSPLDPAATIRMLRGAAELQRWETLGLTSTRGAAMPGSAWWARRAGVEITLVALPTPYGSRVTLQTLAPDATR